MAGAKYKYNTRTLSYEKVETGVGSRMLRWLSYLAFGVVFSIITLVVVSAFVDSPDEKKLNRELDNMRLQVKLLERKADQLSVVLEDIQKRDDNIYRVIFEAEPIPENLRKAGMGGVNRYRHLQGFENADLITAAHRKLDRLGKQLYIQSTSFDSVFTMAKQKEEMLASIPAIQPISNEDLTRMASGYGMRIHPIYKTVMMHEGMDFSAQIGTEVYSTGNGKVVEVQSESRGFGKHVIVDHGFGYSTVYAHLSGFNVRRGQTVSRGEVLGYVGSTGTSTAPHLHYEVRKNGKAINPANFYFNDLTPEEYETMLRISSQVNQSFD